jgi:hypothetical protein
MPELCGQDIAIHTGFGRYINCRSVPTGRCESRPSVAACDRELVTVAASQREPHPPARRWPCRAISIPLLVIDWRTSLGCPFNGCARGRHCGTAADDRDQQKPTARTSKICGSHYFPVPLPSNSTSARVGAWQVGDSPEAVVGDAFPDQAISRVIFVALSSAARFSAGAAGPRGACRLAEPV